MNHILTYADHHKLFLTEVAVGAALAKHAWAAVAYAAAFCFNWLFPIKAMVNSNGAGVVLRYLNNHAKKVRWTVDSYDVKRTHLKSEDKERTVPYSSRVEAEGLFIYNGVPILSVPRHALKGVDMWVEHGFRVVRGTVNWEALMLAATREFDNKIDEAKEGRTTFFAVHRMAGGGTTKIGKDGKEAQVPQSSEHFDGVADVLIGYGEDELGYPVPANPTEHLALTATMQEVLDAVEFWHRHETWYKAKSMPWRLGVLLYGKPGTGKTSIVRAVGQSLDVSVYIFDLSSMSNKDFTEAWESTKGSARIVLLEDFDTVFKGRVNLIKGSKLTLDHILNTLDGVDKEDGLLLFVTTNHPENIDPAVGTVGADGKSTRPGRIDVVAEMKNLTQEGRVKVATRIVDDEVEAAKLAFDGGDDTPAQFIERCRMVAQAQLWSKRG